MKFLYKIYSGYDGFRPDRLPERVTRGGTLQLGWRRYLDVVEPGQEVWVYFHGPGRFDPGVYAKGFVREVHLSDGRVLLRVREQREERPLTDDNTTQRIANLVAARGQQVFLFPEEWRTAPACTVEVDASSCEARHCESCDTWRNLPRVGIRSYHWPHRLPGELEGFVPAYWVIPRRCYLWGLGDVARTIKRTSELFYRFKTGEKALGFPLALAMYQQLVSKKRVDFDAIVPIPLSPDKAERGEINRTRELAQHLAALLGTPVRSLLSLTEPISKRALGLGPSPFETEYRRRLQVSPAIARLESVLLVDDVCTRGSTLRVASKTLAEAHPQVRVVCATAGQMILQQVVVNERQLLA